MPYIPKKIAENIKITINTKMKASLVPTVRRQITSYELNDKLIELCQLFNRKLNQVFLNPSLVQQFQITPDAFMVNEYQNTGISCSAG